MSVSDLARRANNALNDNPPVAINDLTTSGSDFLWMVFSVMAATTLGVGVWCAVGVPRGQRVFHHLSMMITATASVAYFCMASDLGATPIQVEFVRGMSRDTGVITRSIWYVRYIDWTVTTPLLLLELLLVTGLPLSDIVITIFADEVMIVTGLVGALVKSQYKFGLFSIGCFAMLYVFYQLYFPGRQSTRALGAELSKTYLIGAGILSFLWFLYPIAWGLCDGGEFSFWFRTFFLIPIETDIFSSCFFRKRHFRRCRNDLLRSFGSICKASIRNGSLAITSKC
jgi:bacteriorhodopsin